MAWTWRYADSDSRQAIFGVGFGAKRLVAAGDKGLNRVSEDGGLHWKLPEAGFPSVFSFMRDVVFGTPERGWIVGEGSLVLRTSDGGLTWEKMLLDLTAQERAAPDHGAGE